VNTATEATDEERRREEKSKRGQSHLSPAPSSSGESPANPVTPVTEVESPALCQIVDSEKVIQLLAHQPPHKKSATNIFLKNLSKKPTPGPRIFETKKLNRVL